MLPEGDIDRLPLTSIDFTIKQHFQERYEQDITKALAEEMTTEEEQHEEIKREHVIEQPIVAIKQEENDEGHVLLLENIYQKTRDHVKATPSYILGEKNSEEELSNNESFDDDFSSNDLDDETHCKLDRKLFFRMSAREGKKIQKKLAEDPQPLTYYMDQLLERVMANRHDEKSSPELRIVKQKNKPYLYSIKLSYKKVRKRIKKNRATPFLLSRIKKNPKRSRKVINS